MISDRRLKTDQYDEEIPYQRTVIRDITFRLSVRVLQFSNMPNSLL